MDVPDDEAIPEDLHSIAEDVAADCPDDILHELRDIGFNAFSFLWAGSSLVVIRLVDLFPLQILEGVSSTRWWAIISILEHFLNKAHFCIGFL